MKRTLKNDPEQGIITEFHSDGETFTIHTRQDVGAIISDAKSRHAAFRPNANWKGDMHHVAHLPLVVMHQLIRQGILSPSGDPVNQKAFRRWLNDPDNKLLRTRPGRV